MENILHVNTPMNEADVRALKAGQKILLSGIIYTGRDAAHKRLIALLDEGKELPLDLHNQFIYVVGPCPAAPGQVIGSAGPTTSYRMDAYSPALIRKAGLRGMIGKGDRDNEVINAMKECGCVYLAATGGAGALIAGCVKASSVVCYEDLGPEAIFRLEVKDFPLVVAIDAMGNNLYHQSL